MKKVYESPVMMAEAYETNAYCAGCGAMIKNGELILNQNSTFNSSNKGGNNWQEGYGLKKTDLYHTFKNSSIDLTVDGYCGNTGGYPFGGSNECEDKAQSVWKCTCTRHPGETWYLEWSHYYSVHENGQDTFFLYKETNGTSGLTITPTATSWPQQQSGTDLNVAQVIYQEGESMVIAS